MLYHSEILHMLVRIVCRISILQKQGILDICSFCPSICFLHFLLLSFSEIQDYIFYNTDGSEIRDRITFLFFSFLTFVAVFGFQYTFHNFHRSLPLSYSSGILQHEVMMPVELRKLLAAAGICLLPSRQGFILSGIAKYWR
mgnify:CR=1 FL=1